MMVGLRASHRAAASSNGVVDPQHNDGAHDRDDHAPEIEAGDPRSAEGAEYEAADDGSDDPQHDVEQQALTLRIDDLASDESRDQAQYDPADDGHEDTSACIKTLSSLSVAP